MKTIISKLYKIIKETANFIEMEEQAYQTMYEYFTSFIGDIFSEIDEALVSQKLTEGWKKSE